MGWELPELREEEMVELTGKARGQRLGRQAEGQGGRRSRILEDMSARQGTSRGVGGSAGISAGSSRIRFAFWEDHSGCSVEN